MRTSNGIHVAIAKNSTVCLSVTNGCADHHHMGNMQTYPAGGEDAQCFTTRVHAFEACLLVPGFDTAREVEVVVDQAGNHSLSGNLYRFCDGHSLCGEVP